MDMIPKVANGNISPSRVVKTIGAGIDNGVLQCAASSIANIPFGIAQNWTMGSPGTPFDNTFAAIAGEPILVWGPGATAVAATQFQTANIAAGAPVGSNANGELIQALTTTYAVGFLLEATHATRRWRLRVHIHPMYIV